MIIDRKKQNATPNTLRLMGILFHPLKRLPINLMITLLMWDQACLKLSKLLIEKYSLILRGNYTNPIDLIPASTEEIVKTIESLKHSCSGWDEISSMVVKRLARNIVGPPTFVCNLSLISGKIPMEMKIASVSSIYKSGDVSVFNNYRSISVLNTFSTKLKNSSNIFFKPV